MKKRTLTLIEVMIVILLISLIGGVIGYNVKGSLKRGKEFKSKQAKAQLEDILDLCLQDGTDPAKILANTAEVLKESGLAKDPESLLKDGFGTPFKITYDRKNNLFKVE